MITEITWLKVVAPVPVSTFADLAEAAPKGTFIRNGGSVVLGGETHQVLEFVFRCNVVQQTMDAWEEVKDPDAWLAEVRGTEVES